MEGRLTLSIGHHDYDDDDCDGDDDDGDGDGDDECGIDGGEANTVYRSS